MDAGSVKVNRLKGEFEIAIRKEGQSQYRAVLLFTLPKGGVVRSESALADSPNAALGAVPVRPFEQFINATVSMSPAFRELAARSFGEIPDPEEAAPDVAPPPSPAGFLSPGTSGDSGAASSRPVKAKKQWRKKTVTKESVDAAVANV